MAKKRGIYYLSIKDINKLVKLTSSQREKLIIKTLFETGCTVNELIQIKKSDLSKDHIHFPASNTKSKRSKDSQVSSSLISELNKFCTGEFLFSTRQSAMMTTKRVRQLIQFLGKKAGFPTKLNPQTLRYSHIAHALKNGISLNAIQEQTGLEKLRLMQLYEELSTKDTDYNKFWT